MVAQLPAGAFTAVMPRPGTIRFLPQCTPLQKYRKESRADWLARIISAPISNGEDNTKLSSILTDTSISC